LLFALIQQAILAEFLGVFAQRRGRKWLLFIVKYLANSIFSRLQWQEVSCGGLGSQFLVSYFGTASYEKTMPRSCYGVYTAYVRRV
jgi:hypothetical protein